MWIATEIADGFDKLRQEDNRILDDVFQGWVDYAVKHEDDPVWYSALRNAAIYTGTGVLYGAWKLSSTVASGFLDTLRLGDGVPVRPIIVPSDLNQYSSTVCTDQYRMVMNDGEGTVVTSKKCVTETYEYKTYKVRAGDCLTKISKACYGTPNLWKMIYQANRQLLGPDPHDPKALRVGMVLHIVMSAKREETSE